MCPSLTSPEMLLVLIAQGLVLWRVGLYRGLWRFASVPDLFNLAKAAVFGRHRHRARPVPLQPPGDRAAHGAAVCIPSRSSACSVRRACCIACGRNTRSRAPMRRACAC
jgi:hypothetical protein